MVQKIKTAKTPTKLTSASVIVKCDNPTCHRKEHWHGLGRNGRYEGHKQSHCASNKGTATRNPYTIQRNPKIPYGKELKHLLRQMEIITNKRSGFIIKEIQNAHKQKITRKDPYKLAKTHSKHAFRGDKQ